MSKTSKITNIILFGVSIIILLLFYFQSSSGIFSISNVRNVLGTFNMVDGIYIWSYLLLGSALLLVLILSLAKMTKKSFKSTGILLVIVIAIVLTSYFIASGDPVPASVAKEPTFAQLKMTDTGLIITYILMGVTACAFIFGEVLKFIRNRK